MQRPLYIDEVHTALDIFRFAVFFLFASTEWTFHSGQNGAVHSGRNWMDHFILAGMEWSIPFQLEWISQFHSDQNQLVHSILTFWKAWNKPFHSSRSELIHFCQSGMNHFILVGVDWTISVCLELTLFTRGINGNDYCVSTKGYLHFKLLDFSWISKTKFLTTFEFKFFTPTPLGRAGIKIEVI